MALRRDVLRGLALLPASLLSASPKKLSTEEAFERLKHVNTFAFGGVGFAGTISEGETAFRVVAAQPAERAFSAFMALSTEGTAAAKCYALAGLRRLCSAQFPPLYAKMASSKEGVSMMEGCSAEESTVGVVATGIQKGRYPQAAPDRSLAACQAGRSSREGAVP